MGIFNRKRDDLIGNGNMVKYLGYATGEILIVTIGIFIAIQLNNWNQNRKTENKIQKVFEEIEVNLKNNQTKLKPLIKWYRERDSLIQLVKKGKLTEADYEANENLLTLINFYRELQIEKSGYIKLEEYMDVIPTKYDSVLTTLNVIYGQIVPMAERYALVMENFNHRMHERWAEKYDWFSEPRDLAHKKERIEHFLHSPEYQNDVRLYSMYSKDNYVLGLRYVERLSELACEGLERIN